MGLTTVADFSMSGPDWPGGRAASCCRALESGEILQFEPPPPLLPVDDRDFLLGQRQSGFKAHKNISYRPATGDVRGTDAAEPAADTGRMREIMKSFSDRVAALVDRALRPYAAGRKLDFASYRPIEELNRDLPVHKRNDLMHVDAFPTRPTFGGRILRVFLNINPTRERVWETAGGFEPVARKYAADAGLLSVARSHGKTSAKLGRVVLKRLGVKGADRSAYDRFMLRFHDFLKENEGFQKEYPRSRWAFGPGSVWMVYTDSVPHAVLSGQFALEQTFIVPMAAMVTPAEAPLRVLERLSGQALV
jgi:hypothetical protein